MDINEVIILKVGKDEKYKTISEAVVAIPQNPTSNYEIHCVDNPSEFIKITGST